MSKIRCLSRRQFLRAGGCGFGYLAFAAAGSSSLASAAKSPEQMTGHHHPPRAKRVIFLFMHGGPSHVDTFDFKPKLQQDDGRPMPFEPAKNISAKNVLMASPWRHSRHGESGMWVSELLPETAKHIDDLCVVRSLHSQGQSHGQAVCMLHTGTDSLVRPSVGAWLSYGLGSDNENLPAFVSISPPAGHGGPRNYGSAFLPAMHQATTIGQSGKLGDATIRHLRSKLTRRDQRRQLELLQQMNEEHLRRAGSDLQIEGAIEAMELAYRMQGVAPEVLDLSGEPRHVLELYGIGHKQTENYGRQCLLARRLAEAGVRYIQVSTPFVFDQHGNLQRDHPKHCFATDRPVAGLLTDLKSRGLLDDTLVVWGGEFGRTPIVQGSNGRDHNPQGFTMWLAGGGVKRGLAYGNTDEYGYYAVENRVHMHDLHATLLHLMGLDHTRLTYQYGGRDFRLTDVYGQVVRGLLA